MTQANILPSLAPARVRSESRVVPCGWWRLLSSRQLSLPPQHARLLRLLPPISRLHRSQRLARCIGREDAAVFLQPRASHRPPPALPSSPGVVAVVAVVGGTVLHQPSTLRLKTLQALRSHARQVPRAACRLSPRASFDANHPRVFGLSRVTWG